MATVTPAREWKKKGQTGNIDLTLPSGNVALVRRLQPEAFLTSGLIPDSLSVIIAEAIQSNKGLPPKALDDMSKDPKKLSEALKMVDEILCYVVMDPAVEMPPKCGCGQYFDVPQHTDGTNTEHHVYLEEARDEDTLYADEVDLNDKMFIFQFCVGGTADVESFREELAVGVGDISERKVVESKAERTSGHK